MPLDGFSFQWASYQAFFREVGEEPAVGEGSTTYWYAPQAARAIYQRYPAARFILMLRDPADRFFSHYLTTRWTAPLASCRDFFALALERRQGWGFVLDMGQYATNLRRFLEYFPRDQFSIHLYEDFCSDPNRVCREISSFLGVDADHPVDTSERVNEPMLPRSAALHALRLSWAGSSRLLRIVPDRWREALRRLYREPRSRVIMDVEDRRAIIEYYRDEIVQTSELIGRDLSSWLE